MSTTPHSFVPEEIMAHLDGQLSPARAQSVSAHIETCAACQELVTSLRDTSHSLSQWTVCSVPALLEKSVMLAAAKLRSHSPFQDSNVNVHDHRWTRKQWIGGLAATAAVLLLMISISTSRRPRTELQKAIALQEKRESQARATNNLPVDFARINSAGKQQNADRTSYTLDGSVAVPSAPPPAGGPQAGNGYTARLSERVKNPIPSSTVTPAAPMIARTVSLSIIAKDFDSARASLDGILARHHGYAADLNVATPQGAARSLQASLRIPAAQLPAALAEIKALGRAEAETQNGEEVTQQHADLVARLKNSRETEQRLQAILTQRTGKISDVLEVEQEIARVRGEIEQMEAEQKNLEHRVDFATIDLKLSEEYKAKLDSATPSISTQIHNAAVNGYRNVADTLLSIILFFAEYGPVLAFWLLMFSIPAGLVWRRWRHATAAI
jgi:hypothetical protein